EVTTEVAQADVAEHPGTSAPQQQEAPQEEPAAKPDSDEQAPRNWRAAPTIKGCHPASLFFAPDTLRIRSVAPQPRLHLQLQPEPALDILLNIPGQGHDVAAPGATQIDQHQRLLPMHPYPLPGMALPPGLLDQPAGGQLDAAIDLRVMRHARPARQHG